MIIVTDPELKMKMVDACNGQAFIKTAAALLVAVSTDTSYTMRCGVNAGTVDTTIVLQNMVLQAEKEGLVYCSINTPTMADALLLRIQDARSAAYPRRYVRNEQRRRQEKRFSPKGISSLVNFFLILRSRTTEGTLRSLFVGIASNLRIPLSSYFESEHLQRRRQKKSFSPKGISSLVNFFLILRSRTTEGTMRSLFVGIASNLSIPLIWYLWNSTPSTCYIGSFFNDQVKRLLSIPSKMEVIQILTLGYADEAPEPRPRKDLKEFYCHNKYE